MRWEIHLKRLQVTSIVPNGCFLLPLRQDGSDDEVADAGAKFKGTLTLDSRFPAKVTA